MSDPNPVSLWEEFEAELQGSVTGLTEALEALLETDPVVSRWLAHADLDEPGIPCHTRPS